MLTTGCILGIVYRTTFNRRSIFTIVIFCCDVRSVITTGRRLAIIRYVTLSEFVSCVVFLWQIDGQVILVLGWWVFLEGKLRVEQFQDGVTPAILYPT